jgi:hypothetical protein
MADGSKTCPQCGAALHFRLGAYECAGCGYASTPAAAEEPLAALQRPAQDSGGQLDVATAMQLLQPGAAAPRVPVGAMRGDFAGPDQGITEVIAAHASLAGVVCIILAREYWYNLFYVHTPRFNSLTGAQVPPGAQLADLTHLFVYALLALLGVIVISACCTSVATPGVRWGLSLPLLAGLSVLFTQLVLSLFGQSPMAWLSDFPFSIRGAVALCIIAIIVFMLWRLQGGHAVARINGWRRREPTGPIL